MAWKKYIITKIIEKCENNNIIVSKDIVSFILHLWEFNPSYQVVNIDNDNKIIDAITDKLIDEKSPSLNTLKIQLYFAKHYSTKNEIIKKHRQKIKKKTSPLVDEICKTIILSNERDIDKLYQKILIIITLLSGLGNPMESSVLKEVAIALQSVYLPSELTNFVLMKKIDKENQLQELVNIIAGIRLFNKDCQRGGESIDDLPSILKEAVVKTRDSILELLEDLMKTVYRLTAAVENIVEILSFDNTTYVNEKKIDKEYTWIIEMLIAYRQQEIYTRKILVDVDELANDLNNLMDRLQARLLKLHNTVKFRTAIPILQVYPQFIDLADIWMKLQDQVILLTHIKNIFCEMKLFYEIIEIHDESIINIFIKNNNVPSDAKRLEQSMGKIITECGDDCSIIYPNTTKDFEKIPLEFLGFCAWSFVTGHGALIPGNPNIGIVKFINKYFAFSSNNAAKKFSADPTRYVSDGFNFIRCHPEYIQLFQLYDDLKTFNNQQTLNDNVIIKLHQDEISQTDTHIISSNIDCNYHHSIWEHRRRALRLADISKLSTKSTQTNLSYFKKTVSIQTKNPKNISIQTRRDNYSNTINQTNYIHGLRGNKINTPKVLTFSLN